MTKLFDLLECYINSKCECPDINYEFRISLVENSKPFYFTPRRLSWYERNEIKRITNDLLSRDVIKPSNSDYCSPIVLVAKKDKSYRMCVDYRRLNKVTIKDRHPLPLIEDQIDRLAGTRVFTSLDLKDGFHHIPISEDSIKFTSFVTPDGQFEYLKMPFGLANAPAAFQRYINLIFKPLFDSGQILIYLDDILIATPAIQENLTVLKEVLDLLARFELC